MENIFLLYLQAGLLGSCLILVVLALRLILRKAPKNILCVLWMVVMIRLLLPFQIESRLSMQPAEILHVVPTQSQQICLPQSVPAVQAPPVEEKITPVDVATVIWACGAGGMFLYAVGSYLYLRCKVLKRAKECDGVWLNESIDNAFLLGYFHPRIILPARLKGAERELVLAHERAHLSRGDNWWKLLGYIGIVLHWYNPLVWLGYILMSRDIEFACDQRVIRDMDLQDRKAYSMVLLNSGTMGFGYTSIPVSFAEVSLKKRIKNVLNYRKSAFWITGIAVLAVAIAAVCFLTIPQSPEEPVNPAEPSLEQITEPDILEEETTEPITEPATEPITEPATEPITEPITEPVTQPATEPTAPPLSEPVVEETISQPPVEQLPSEPVEEDVEIYDPYHLAPWDQKFTAYAAACGFQTMESYPNTDVKCFSFYMAPKFGDSRFEQDFYSAGCQAVDKAYQYCKENNAIVENSLVWVEISYNAVVGYCNVWVYCAAAY